MLVELPGPARPRVVGAAGGGVGDRVIRHRRADVPGDRINRLPERVVACPGSLPQPGTVGEDDAVTVQARVRPLDRRPVDRHVHTARQGEGALEDRTRRPAEDRSGRVPDRRVRVGAGGALHHTAGHIPQVGDRRAARHHHGDMLIRHVIAEGLVRQSRRVPVRVVHQLRTRQPVGHRRRTRDRTGGGGGCEPVGLVVAGRHHCRSAAGMGVGGAGAVAVQPRTRHRATTAHRRELVGQHMGGDHRQHQTPSRIESRSSGDLKDAVEPKSPHRRHRSPQPGSRHTLPPSAV